MKDLEIFCGFRDAGNGNGDSLVKRAVFEGFVKIVEFGPPGKT